MSKYTPHLYIDTTLTNTFEYKPHYNPPYTPIQHKYKPTSSIQSTQPSSSSRNTQLYHFNSQSHNSHNDHKTDNNDPKFSFEKRSMNRMPSPLLRTTPKVIKVNKAPETIDINDLLGKDAKRPLTIDMLTSHVDNFEPSRTSKKTMGNIKAYAVNTHQGIVRNYNEDRVSIIINMAKPSNYKGQWPKVSFFGIYDGHGGANCAEYLRDNLHIFIASDEAFPHDVPNAIINGFAKAEKDFITNHALSKGIEVIDKSGSCAVVTMIVDEICYVANVGDSRAIMSSSNGVKCTMITIDHKPNYQSEKTRINENGGRVYQSQTPLFAKTPKVINQVLLGPFRVFPGRLSVSRTVGDVEAKKEKFGGLPNVIIAVPEVFRYDLEDIDFLIMGCDGIFDQLSNQDVSDCVWMALNDKKEESIHMKCSSAVDMVIKASLARKSLDNVTCLMIAFKEFDGRDKEKLSQSQVNHELQQLGNYINEKTKPLSSTYRPHDPVSKYINTYSNNTVKGNTPLKQKQVSKKASSDAIHNHTLNTQPNNTNTPTIRSEKARNTLNTSRYLLNNIHAKEKTDNKYLSTTQATSSNVYTFNQFLTPANPKASKEAISLRKKKELTLNNDPKYCTLYTENYPSYTMNKQTHTMNSQRYDSKYRSKYSNL